MNYGVLSTPALVINGKVVVKGRVPSQDELFRLLTSNV
jgi:protein-disulfide isomerase